MALKARPTTYKGVEMRSRLEARAANFFEVNGFQWTYEPRCFADEHGQYLPDFRLDGIPDLIADPENMWAPVGPPCPVYVEVKPTPAHAEGVALRTEIIWSSDPSARILLIWGDSRWKVGLCLYGHPDYSTRAFFTQCQACKGTILLLAEGSYACWRCGAHDGDHHLGPELDPLGGDY